MYVITKTYRRLTDALTALIADELDHYLPDEADELLCTESGRMATANNVIRMHADEGESDLDIGDETVDRQALVEHMDSHRTEIVEAVKDAG